MPASPLIDADFAGGNVVVDRIEGQTVYLRQDQRDTPKPWFYWHFRVRGAVGQRLRFIFTDGNVIGPMGPCVSTEGDGTYRWLGSGDGNGTFEYEFPLSPGETFFCFCLPYTERHLQTFVDAYREARELQERVLCTTPEGRAFRRFDLSRLDHPRKVVFTARHHACETSGSYALEGVLWQMAEDPWWRTGAHVVVFPFIDPDGVERGDQGKARNGYDHNRDYLGPSRYPEVAALRRDLASLGKGRIDAAIDLHCPWIRGPQHEVIHLVGSRRPTIWAEQQRLAEFLAREATGPLRYHPDDNLPFGKDWNTEANEAGGRSFASWAAGELEARLSTTLEIPYAKVRSLATSPDNLRAFGRQLANALKRYLG